MVTPRTVNQHYRAADFTGQFIVQIDSVDSSKQQDASTPAITILPKNSLLVKNRSGRTLQLARCSLCSVEHFYHRLVAGPVPLVCSGNCQSDQEVRQDGCSPRSRLQSRPWGDNGNSGTERVWKDNSPDDTLHDSQAVFWDGEGDGAGCG